MIEEISRDRDGERWLALAWAFNSFRMRVSLAYLRLSIRIKRHFHFTVGVDADRNGEDAIRPADRRSFCPLRRNQAEFMGS